MSRTQPRPRPGRRLAVALVPMLAFCAPDVGRAAPGGPIGVLPLGTYICELPGDATGPAGLRQRDEEFRITHGSSYRTDRGPGIYLLTGDRLTFTSGPLKGGIWHRTGRSFLRRVQADGSDGALRCVRQGSSGR
ncbi:MAG TPA: hypothetical protein VI199_00745 [Novosphingobium sp.]